MNTPELSIDGAIATLTLRRPEQANRLGPDDLAVLAGHIAAVNAAPDVLVLRVQATGNIQPTTEVEVSSERSGVIRNVNVKANSVVKKGDVLAELDTERLQAERARGKAAVAATEARLADARATLLEKQLLFNRAEKLSSRGVSSTQDVDTARAAQSRAEAGVVSYPAGIADAALQGRGALRASGRVMPRLRLSAGVGREPFDDVVTMARRALMFSSGDIDLAYTLRPKLSLGLASSVGQVGGAGVEAQRIVGLGAIRWTPIPAATFALQHREASWDKPQFGVFFSPQRWTTTEVNASWERQARMGFQLGGDLAIGSQGIRFEGDPELTRSMAPRAAMRAGWRLAPGREILAGLLYANVAGAGAVMASDYRYGAFTLTGRWTF